MTRPDSPIPLLQRQTLAWLAIVGATCLLLWLLAPVLTPFLLAAILGYILNPGVDWLAKRRVPRWLASLLMLLLLLAMVIFLVLIIVPVLQKEFLQAREKLPGLLARMQTGLAPRLSSWFGIDVELNAQVVRAFVAEHFAVESVAKSALAYLRIGGAAALSWAATAFLALIVLFYLLIDWHMVWSRFATLVPRGVHARVGTMTGEIDHVLSKFLRGQLLVMLVLAVYYSAALAVARFEIALPVGILTGLLVFIPYVGFFTGLVLALLAATLQFGNLYGFLAVAVIYGLGQVLETVILVPRLVGESIGLHPIAVIFALLAFGELFGFFGILLALPVSAVLVVALTHARRHYVESDFYRDAGSARRARAALERPDRIHGAADRDAK
ncbi:MAG: AI-2E family transporter [Burkholderiaceae bacterium]